MASNKEMENNSSDEKNFNKNGEKEGGNEVQNILSSKNDDTKSLKTNQKNSISHEVIQKQDTTKENVVEKVEGDTVYPTDLEAETVSDEGQHYIASDNLENTEDPEELVMDWEINHPDIKLSKKARKIASISASLHIHEKRGITVKDLRKLGMNKDSAERRLQLTKDKGLFIPHEVRIGKQKQYILSNYKYILDSHINKKKKSDYEITPAMLDKDLIVQLLRALSSRKYTFHHIHMQTNLLYKEDYDRIKWKIPSTANNQKVSTFKLTQRRKCTFTVSPTGTVGISFECTLDPYLFHDPSGIVEFFGSCGQALQILKNVTHDRFAVVPSISNWYLLQFEYNKDIPTKDPIIASWAPINGRLRIEYLGTLFQIYPKGLPDVENILRIEAKNTMKEKKKVVDAVSDIIESKRKSKIEGVGGISPFNTAEKLLKRAKENLDS
jgi:hypothetical protein